MPQTEKSQRERTNLVQGKTGDFKRGQGPLVTETESIVFVQEKFEKYIEIQKKMSPREVAGWCGAEVRNLDDPQMTYREGRDESQGCGPEDNIISGQYHFRGNLEETKKEHTEREDGADGCAG